MNGVILLQFWITFGFGQELEGCYTIVEAPNEADARLHINMMYGSLWSFIYRTAEEAGVERFNLHFVELGTPNSKK